MGLNDRVLQQKDDKKNKRSTKGSLLRNSEASFVSFSPTKEQKVEVARIALELNDSWVALLQNVGELGYKFSFKYSDKGVAFVASLIGTDTSPNPDVILSVYHAEPVKCIAQLILATAEAFRLDEAWTVFQTRFDNEW